MNYKYRSLLMNIPVRHLINKMKKDDMEKEKQLKMMTDIDLNNIFLLGRKSMIEQYLAVANKLKMYGMKYSWFAMSKVKDVGFKERHLNNLKYTICVAGKLERHGLRLQSTTRYNDVPDANCGQQSAVHQTEPRLERL